MVDTSGMKFNESAKEKMINPLFSDASQLKERIGTTKNWYGSEIEDAIQKETKEIACLQIDMTIFGEIRIRKQ